MSRIKVVMHSKTVGYSGTDKACQLFAKHIDKSRFQPFIVYREDDPANTRLDIIRRWLGDDHVIPYKWIPGDSGRRSPYIPQESNLGEVLAKIDPDIVHVHRSGYNEWPLKVLAPRAKWVETNIFGYNDVSRQLDLSIYIADYVRNRALQSGGPNGPTLYNPIEQPVLDMTPQNKAACREEILKRWKVSANADVLGRVGRPDNFDPISLRAFAEVVDVNPNAFYLIVNPCDQWRKWASKLGIESNIRFLDPIIEDDELSKFYMALDIYAHARHDGEMCPTNIQEAMMHGVPVVSHESAIYNGQSEIIGDAGFVVPLGNHVAYRDVLLALLENKEFVNEDETGMVRLRDYFGRAGRRRAMRYFEAETMISHLMKIYDSLLTVKT